MGSGSEGGSGSLLSEGSSGTETLLSGAEEASGREELSSDKALYQLTFS